MFPSVRFFFSEALDLGKRGVSALEVIVERLDDHNQVLRGYGEDSEAFRPLLQRIQDLTQVVGAVAVAQQELGPSVQRLNDLELSRVRFEAECEGMLLKADGKLRAANASEARERQFKRSNEKTFADPFPLDGEEAEGATLHTVDAPTGETERMPGLYMGLARNNKKARAQAAKWGTQ